MTSDDKLRSFSFYVASFRFGSRPFPFFSEQFAKLSDRSVAAQGCIARTRGRVLPCPHGGHWPSPRATWAALATKSSSKHAGKQFSGTSSKRQLGSTPIHCGELFVAKAVRTIDLRLHVS